MLGKFFDKVPIADGDLHHPQIASLRLTPDGSFPPA
jgi:hypothetical protein